MSVVGWFAIGAGAALTLAAWRWCVRLAMWKVFAPTMSFSGSPTGRPSIPGGLFGGTAMLLTIWVWAPIWGAIILWDRVDAARLLTERVFPRPQ